MRDVSQKIKTLRTAIATARGTQRLRTRSLQLALGLVLVVASSNLILPWLV